MTCLVAIVLSVVLINSATGCGPNEVEKDGIDCVSDCCPQPKGEPSLCPDPCATACKCQLLYKRAKNGTCIPARECPPIPCGENEAFDSCPVCSEKCANASPPSDNGNRCRIIGVSKRTVICDPACRCIPNYWRNDYNKCVPYYECPQFSDCN